MQRYIHVSVDLIVVPKYRTETVDGELVKVPDGFQCYAEPKDKRRTYSRDEPKRKSKRRIRIESRGKRNSWGA